MGRTSFELNLAHPGVVGKNGNVRYCTEECAILYRRYCTYRKANSGMSMQPTDVENRRQYLFPCRYYLM